MVTKKKLDSEVSEARRFISADGYPMSIGELTNLYRDQELIIRPEFQRFFRWSSLQKSRLVESILLGIPLPSIFVAQRDTGKWEIVDGLQRVSTILELQGELIGADGILLPPLVLEATDYLSCLEGKAWTRALGVDEISDALKLDIKRTKLDIKIIKRESSSQAKYDLFQRLNSYGSTLTAQELRSALLVAVSPDFLTWLEQLAAYPPFVESVLLGDRLLEERYDLELVLRFLVLHNRPLTEISQRGLRDFSGFVDRYSISLATKNPLGSASAARIFKKTFDVVAANGGDDVFRRWYPDRNSFLGSFLNSAFEVIALGLGYHVANRTVYRTELLDVAREFWTRPDMTSGFATGKSSAARLTQLIPLGRQLLRK